jgi:hypothetical protein
MRALAAGIAVLMLAGCNGGSASPSPTPSPTTTPAGPHLFVADSGNNSIFIFARDASGVALPQITVNGPATLLSSPFPIAVDRSGNIWVGNHSSPPELLEFRPDAVGDAAPQAIMTVSSTVTPGALSATGLTFGPDGKLYVATGTDQHIMVYSAGANGTPTPIQDINGLNTQINDAEGIALDSSGNIYTASFGSNAILEFAAGANGNVAPIRVIKGVFNTRLSSPSYVAVDGTGNVFALNSGGIVTEYAAGASGDVAPIATFGGFNISGQMVFDGSGKFYAGASDNANGVAVYAPPLSSSSVPGHFLQSPIFSSPTGVFTQ